MVLRQMCEVCSVYPYSVFYTHTRGTQVDTHDFIASVRREVCNDTLRTLEMTLCVIHTWLMEAKPVRMALGEGVSWCPPVVGTQVMLWNGGLSRASIGVRVPKREAGANTAHRGYIGQVVAQAGVVIEPVNQPSPLLRKEENHE